MSKKLTPASLSLPFTFISNGLCGKDDCLKPQKIEQKSIFAGVVLANVTKITLTKLFYNPSARNSFYKYQQLFATLLLFQLLNE
uniref:Uncharacterized protein n=1 Tax=Glossina brevipalpis TaxID=37001 RepID=A0A1A9X535_9MUSC